MTFDQMKAILTREGIDTEIQVEVIGATMRARNRMSRAFEALFASNFTRVPKEVRYGMRIVLRPNGICRAEINRGRVRGGIVVAVVNR